jgi:polyhydroxyalkanoate synthesis repressor PhaR
MPVIKRYPNRKLYDTQAKQYITLDRIAELIREGSDIQVIDHASGEDITALTLSQVILEQEKRQSGFLPHALLSNLIQAGGVQFDTIQRSLISRRDIPELEETIEEIIRQRNLPTKEEVDRLARQLEELASKLEKLV